MSDWKTELVRRDLERLAGRMRLVARGVERLMGSGYEISDGECCGRELRRAANAVEDWAVRLVTKQGQAPQ